MRGGLRILCNLYRKVYPSSFTLILSYWWWCYLWLSCGNVSSWSSSNPSGGY
jgi:hypothetical protein